MLHKNTKQNYDCTRTQHTHIKKKWKWSVVSHVMDRSMLLVTGQLVRCWTRDVRELCCSSMGGRWRTSGGSENGALEPQTERIPNSSRPTWPLESCIEEREPKSNHLPLVLTSPPLPLPLSPSPLSPSPSLSSSTLVVPLPLCLQVMVSCLGQGQPCWSRTAPSFWKPCKSFCECESEGGSAHFSIRQHTVLFPSHVRVHFEVILWALGSSVPVCLQSLSTDVLFSVQQSTTCRGEAVYQWHGAQILWFASHSLIPSLPATSNKVKSLRYLFSKPAVVSKFTKCFTVHTFLQVLCIFKGANPPNTMTIKISDRVCNETLPVIFYLSAFQPESPFSSHYPAWLSQGHLLPALIGWRETGALTKV